MGLFHRANSLKWNALFGEITFFFSMGKWWFYRKENIFPSGKLRSFFPLNILLGDEDVEYPAASRPLQQPAKGGNIYLGAWPPSVSLGCSCQFYSCEITKILSSRQREDKIYYGSSKTVLFFLEFPFYRAKKHISKFKLLKLYHLLKEWMWLSQLFYLRHSLDVCPT